MALCIHECTLKKVKLILSEIKRTQGEHMNALVDKLLKNSTIKETALLTDSKIYGKKDMIPTEVPMINVALSGKIDGGLAPGLTVLAGPSKHFKSAFSLLIASAYQKQYKDGVVLFYDSEFGTPESYFDSFGNAKDRTVHTPITDIEQLKHDIMVQLNSIERGDKVCIIIDSVGNLASKKEVDDAIEGKSVADMTRAKAMKSLFRMVTPHLTIKDIPMIVVNHTYKEMSLFPRDVVSGGTGIMYSADNVWILGRQQEKDGGDLSGYNFIINVEKSRFVKEKSKIPITVNFDGGISKYSGLADTALEGGYITKVKVGRSNGYQVVNKETGELVGEPMLEKDARINFRFWKDVFEKTDFKDYIHKTYAIGTGKMLMDDIDET